MCEDIKTHFIIFFNSLNLITIESSISQENVKGDLVCHSHRLMDGHLVMAGHLVLYWLMVELLAALFFHVFLHGSGPHCPRMVTPLNANISEFMGELF